MSKRKPEEERTGSIREKVADALDTSKEVVLDAAKLTFIGNRELLIENYKGIVEYTDSIIRVRAGKDILKICGKRLEIKNITQEMLFIVGCIASLTFEKP